jgi:hypothetical protein
MKTCEPTRIVQMSREEIDEALERAKTLLSTKDHEVLVNLAQAYAYVSELVGSKETTIGRLRNLLFGPSSEKTEKVLKDEGRQEEEPAASEARGAGDAATSAGAGVENAEGVEPKRKGHGRNGASEYRGAKRIEVPHGSLKSGGACPRTGCKGKVYGLKEPAVIVRVRGRAPFEGTVWELQRLRCNLCGEVFSAEAPEGIGEKKYDETSASMIACLRYGAGFPRTRLEKLQGSLGIPLPASTQWEIIAGSAALVDPAYEQLIEEAAQGEVIHNDDTPMKILAMMGERREGEASCEEGPERKGMFTTGVISQVGEERIALFFTGREHAGENLERVLEKRRAELRAPIQMCDGLSRNLPGELEAIVSNCLAHGRRKFVEVVENFPEECRLVLESLGEVYKKDAWARAQGMSPQERLRYHQEESGPRMAELHQWLERQLAEKKVEPNSGLGEAISYMLRRWEKLTVFLREPGAPLDNNICERALKKAILHRKNSLFYKTEKGARVGDVFMSLIHTAELSGADPFDYLTELQKHAEELRESPQEWMPWNYRSTLNRRAERAADQATG